MCIFSLGILYADEMKDQSKSVEAFTRYLELGGNHARARAAVAQQHPTKQSRMLKSPPACLVDLVCSVVCFLVELD